MKRKIAAQLGLTVYETDGMHPPCGTRERYVSTGNCVRCAKLRRVSLPTPRRILAPDQLPATRDEAIQMDSKFYKPTLPCKNGHLCKRYTRSGICVMCNRAAASKIQGTTPDRMKRASGLVKVESWCFPQFVERFAALERECHTEYSRANPAKAPVPILPTLDRHVDDYDMK